MKRITLLLLVAGSLVLNANQPLSARGPGGGARGGGGGGLTNPGMNRPSFGNNFPAAGGIGAPRPADGAFGGTRPATDARPGGITPGFADGARPSAGQLNNFLDVPRPTTGSFVGGGAARPAGGGAAADFLRDGDAGRPGTLPAQRPNASTLPAAGNRPGAGNLQDRRPNVTDNRPGRIDNREEWQQNRQQRVGEVRNQVAENYPRLDFWSDHQNWAAWRINQPYRWATWAALSGWVGYGAAQPVYYNYGDNVYYQDDGVYSGDQQVATAEQYAQQADAIAAAAPDTPPQDSEWLPMGVFAVTQDGQKSGSEPTLFMQLAVSKEGIISGTLDNKATDQTQTLEGMIDKNSQRAAWGVAGKQRPIIETGMNNLTQDAVPALVHFADGQTQQWLLVRLPDPQQPQ